ncbi:PEP/pyruvate-binding domain-containing protein [Propionibacterium australiense]|nr:PEP/pyruvate-binding domain-containing protein [Propionibacterium australiense]SYZ32991.1 ATP-grasp fold, subdomain 1 [Propionibacterium australiense]VEH92287.1 Phosphoenolpyruvate synthase [Propionibacterium australiense]
MIVELTYIRSSDTDSVGRTAARLGERLRNGVETAPGFVVTTDDLAELFNREKLTERLEGVPADGAAAVAAETIAAAELPADLVDDLAESYAALGRDAWVSVQASPTERDLGVSREVLGPVQGVDAVWELIRQVWASLWAPEAIARREDKGVTDAQEKLAVLVQQAEAPAEEAPASAGDTGKAAETAPELPLDEPAEAPSGTEPVASDAPAEAAEADAVVAEAELAEDEGRAVEQAEAIADEADTVGAVADAEPEPAASTEPEPVVEAEPVLEGGSETTAGPETEVIETEAFETPAAGSDKAPGAEEPAGPSQPRTQASGSGSPFAASTEPSGRSRWVVIGLVSFVLLLLVRRLRRR